MFDQPSRPCRSEIPISCKVGKVVVYGRIDVAENIQNPDLALLVGQHSDKRVSEFTLQCQCVKTTSAMDLSEHFLSTGSHVCP